MMTAIVDAEAITSNDDSRQSTMRKGWEAHSLKVGCGDDGGFSSRSGKLKGGRLAGERVDDSLAGLRLVGGRVGGGAQKSEWPSSCDGAKERPQ